MGSIENDIVQIISSIDPSLNPELSWFSILGKTQHVVYLDSFWVDQTEVTNAYWIKSVWMKAVVLRLVKGNQIREKFSFLQ